jgi:diaminohydroxyphosphoribosylaminopyrimidine deaminase/5-amino-6-(5-phosphoribosylamino)uracil reductase
VMSRSLNLPTDAHLWKTAIAPTLVFTEVNANPEFSAYLQTQGVEVIALDSLSPSKVMDILYVRGCNSVLWECGGTLAAKAIAEGIIQKIMAFIAPKIIGGVDAPSPVGDLGFRAMTQALALENPHLELIESDILITGYLQPP